MMKRRRRKRRMAKGISHVIETVLLPVFNTELMKNITCVN
jgi:hypothetical protein